MASDRIEFVRGAVAMLNEGRWQEFFESLPADFEYDLSSTISPLRGVHGRADAIRVAKEFWEPWASVHYEIQELIEVGEQVVMPYRSRFRGRDGIEVEAEATWVWAIEDGELRLLCLFQDLAEALSHSRAGD